MGTSVASEDNGNGQRGPRAVPSEVERRLWAIHKRSFAERLNRPSFSVKHCSPAALTEHIRVAGWNGSTGWGTAPASSGARPCGHVADDSIDPIRANRVRGAAGSRFEITR